MRKYLKARPNADNAFDQGNVIGCKIARQRNGTLLRNGLHQNGICARTDRCGAMQVGLQSRGAGA